LVKRKICQPQKRVRTFLNSFPRRKIFGPNQDRLKIVAVGALLGAGAALYFYSEEIELFGKKRKLLFSRKVEEKIGEFFTKIFLEGGNSSIYSHHYILDHITEIGNRICDANGIERRKFYLVESREQNSFSFIGKSVFISTGILPFLWSDSRIAIVLSHEIAHEVAGHHAQRYFAMPIYLALLFTHGLIAFSLFHYFFILPNNRNQELEADKLGLLLMSRAHFDPEEAISLYKLLELIRGDTIIFASHPDWDARTKTLIKTCKDNDLIEYFHQDDEYQTFISRHIPLNYPWDFPILT